MDVSPSAFDVAVVGGGPAGLAATLALARAGARVVLVAPPPPDDWRTAALFGSSVDFLEGLGLLPAIAAVAAPLRAMRLVDATDRLIRAPEVTFRASEIGRDVFGYNIANRDFTAALISALKGRADVTVLETTLETLAVGAGAARLTLADGRTLSAGLVVGADGRQSCVRSSSGIEVHSWSYPQAALVANLEHDGPHDDTSTEFHTANGPFTLVPFGPGCSSLVWVDRPRSIERLMALDDVGLGEAIGRRSEGLVGRTKLISPRQSFPMSAFRAKRLAAARVVLIGEAAHGFPPLGAQGLNLTLRDVAEIAGAVGKALGAGGDAGAAEVTDAYARRRSGDVAGRVFGVDVLSRSLLSDALPVQLARTLGLGLARRLPPLRRLMLREGMRA